MCNFIFHNVGHGLFYTGVIKNVFNVKEKFLLVYDCGSLNKDKNKKENLANLAIDNFKNTISQEKINLLVISHFHKDHISGLEKLLKEFSVENIIIPYFSPIERFLIALLNPNMDKWYYEFLADPADFIIRNAREIKRIIIIRGDKGKEGPYIFENFEHPENNLDKDNDFNEKLEKNENLLEEIKKYDPKWLREAKVLIRGHRGYITILNLWFFRFFNYREQLDIASDFSSIRNLEEYLKSLDIENLNSETLKKILGNEENLNKLKEFYLNLKEEIKLGSFNNTSLTMFHIPLLILKRENYLYKHCLLCICPYESFLNNYFLVKLNPCYYRIGQMLTGDLNLSNKDIYQKFKIHYSDFLEKIGVFQVPHHGSEREGWNKSIINDTKCKLWVVSSKSTDPRHPSPKVIKDILSSGELLLQANENISVKVQFYLNYF